VDGACQEFRRYIHVYIYMHYNQTPTELEKQEIQS